MQRCGTSACADGKAAVFSRAGKHALYRLPRTAPVVSSGDAEVLTGGAGYVTVILLLALIGLVIGCAVGSSVSFRQACMNLFGASVIVGCRGEKLWRTADGYVEETRAASAA